MRSVTSGWLLVGVLGSVLAGCEGGYELVVRFDPPGLAGEVGRVVVDLVESCEAQPAGGLPPGRVLRTVELTRDGPEPEAFGGIEPGSYGLYGRGWGPDCAVVAAGCAEVEVDAGGSGTLELVLSAVAGPGCPTGEICVDGDCIVEQVEPCGEDGDCDDGLFCNGEERCLPGSAAADERGCVPAASGPCLPGQRCDEASGRCLTRCDENPDADGDGFDAVECGGDDCDDSRDDVYPGAPELCDGVDNNCNGHIDEGFDLSNDLDNCGVCGRVCSRDNATPSCVEGACVLDCDDGWESCDDSADTGCETDVTSDPENCGGCGRTCWFGCVESACEPLVLAAVSCGTAHVCALEASGLVLCWGANGSGQLGDGTTGGHRARPAFVEGLTDAVEVTAGGAHSCARRASGAVVCWGDDSSGQLGNGGDPASAVPVAAVGIASARSVAAGLQHSCAVLTNGTAQCWGGNGSGQLGTGSSASRTAPTTVEGLSDAVEVTAGRSHTCFVRATGAVACSGAGAGGQLGTGRTPARETSPVAVSGLADATAVAAGGAHSCAGRFGGGLVCWGCDQAGQLGDGPDPHGTTCECGPGGPSDCSTVPSAVVDLATGRGPAAGGVHSCALDADGAAWCWGDNSAGGLGDGTTTPRAAPTAVLDLAELTGLCAGEGYSCAVTAAGEASCWGANGSGQLGDGTTVPRSRPAPIADP